jgi:hypothetical protein
LKALGALFLQVLKLCETAGLVKLCKFAGNSDPLRGIIASNSDPF